MKWGENIMNISVLIWGTGDTGKHIVSKSLGDARVKIIGFGDDDKSLVGKNFCDLPIYDIETLKNNIKDIDCVIIARNSSEQLYKTIFDELSVPVFRSYKLFCFYCLNMRCSIDISGWCNARCKYCYTGRNNIMNCHHDAKYMKYDEFVKAYTHLTRTGIMHNFNEVMLYSWGDPFLNPDYLKIIEYLNENNQKYAISTNASNPQMINAGDAYKSCSIAIFSLSGFSKESYSRIHGFDIDIIKKNITNLISNMREHGFVGVGKISFHVYKFNEKEVYDAEAFAKSLGLEFEPVKAYLASWSMKKQFLSNQMEKEVLKEVQSELLIENVDNIIKNRPVDYRCPLENIISINMYGDIELCCCSDEDAKDYSWESIYKINNISEWIDYRKEMLRCDTCFECRKLGVDYWMCNGEKYKF